MDTINISLASSFSKIMPSSAKNDVYIEMYFEDQKMCHSVPFSWKCMGNKKGEQCTALKGDGSCAAFPEAQPIIIRNENEIFKHEQCLTKIIKQHEEAVEIAVSVRQQLAANTLLFKDEPVYYTIPSEVIDTIPASRFCQCVKLLSEEEFFHQEKDNFPRNCLPTHKIMGICPHYSYENNCLLYNLPLYRTDILALMPSLEHGVLSRKCQPCLNRVLAFQTKNQS